MAQNILRNFLVISSLLLIVLQICLAQYSWCDPNLCEKGVTHIACRNNGDFHRRCHADSVEIDISNYKDLFVHEHNIRRNYIAQGQIPGFYPASRMATMLWDNELQYLSSLNTRTCILDHDPCHTTYRYMYSGQNLCGVFGPRTRYVNVTRIIKQVMDLWFDEYPLIDSSYIDHFKVTRHFEAYGHFAEMVVDRNNRVGCSIIQFTRPQYPSVYIYNVVCNYASIYALGEPVYKLGHPASGCRTGRNPSYPGLCSAHEPIDPNYI